MADVFKDRNWGNQLAAEWREEDHAESDSCPNVPQLPLTDRLPLPSEHVDSHDLHQVYFLLARIPPSGSRVARKEATAT